jgi:ParB/RepB/Spo0J family partition protein
MQMIPIASIVPDPKNVRVWDEDSHANQQLIASVKNLGIIQPIRVRQITDDPAYQIIVGHRRLKAAVAAGMAAVPCIVDTETITVNDTAVQLAENIVRAPMRTADVWTAVARLIAEGWDAGDVALAFGLTDRRVHQFTLMGKLPAPVIAYIRETNDIPDDARLRVIVQAESALVEAAFNELLQKHGGHGNFPWWGLAGMVKLTRVTVEHACFTLTEEDHATFDVRRDWFDPADHPGYAYNVTDYIERQVAEVEAKLTDYRKQGFGTLLWRDGDDVTEARVRKTLCFPGDIEGLKKIKKADREGHVIVARLWSDGRLWWQRYEIKPETDRSAVADLTKPTAPAPLVTKACETLIEEAQREAVAAGVKSLAVHDLLAVAVLLLGCRTGYHALSPHLFDEAGRLTEDSEKIMAATLHTLEAASKAAAIPLTEIHRIGATFDFVPMLSLTTEGLSALKKEALEGVFKSLGMPVPDGTQKKAREALIAAHGTEGSIMLGPQSLAPLDWTLIPPSLARTSPADADEGGETEAANDNDPPADADEAAA